MSYEKDLPAIRKKQYFLTGHLGVGQSYPPIADDDLYFASNTVIHRIDDQPGCGVHRRNCADKPAEDEGAHKADFVH